MTTTNPIATQAQAISTAIAIAGKLPTPLNQIATRLLGLGSIDDFALAVDLFGHATKNDESLGQANEEMIICFETYIIASQQTGQAIEVANESE